MSESKDGGPAFPVPVAVGPAGDVYHSELHGMTLRDYFAAKAMQAMLHPDHCNGAIADMREKDESPEDMIGRLAFSAYKHADAMLAERAKAPA